MKVESQVVGTHGLEHHGRIGPNAIIQTVQALKERYGIPQTETLLRRIGHAALITTLPHEMIDEQDFLVLMQALRAQLGLAETGEILQRSGQLTAGYVLANRIPAPVRLLLKLLPPGLALPMLLTAVKKHAWTFVGTGEFSYVLGKKPQLFIVNCVECRGVQADAPICRFYQGAFEGLLRALVSARTQVRETSCGACGEERCTFAVTFAKTGQR